MPRLLDAPASPRFAAGLLAAWALWWAALALRPLMREDWLLENVLVFAALPLILWGWRRAPFSAFSYACLFAFFCLHAVGSHYTYSLVPYDRWFEALAGRPLNAMLGFERNHYDRLVHFLYGFLMAPAAFELVRAVAAPRGAWRFLLPGAFLASHSVVYELIEWSAALMFGGDLGDAYLGTQGDSWDAQKDMALALGGSATMLVLLALSGQGRQSPPCRGGLGGPSGPIG